MVKPIRTFTGPKARKYLADLLASGPGVSAEAAQRVTAALEKEVVAVKVRPAKAAPPANAPLLPFAELPETHASEEQEPDTAPDGGPSAIHDNSTTQSPPPFDPYVFSLVVVLTKEGTEGLLGKLSEVDRADDLKAMAKAQHIALPLGLNTLADIRAAIVAGTERRIADRRAAAS
jgi:hypothetical protein